MRSRWVVTVAAALAALPYLAWLGDPAGRLLPAAPGPLTPASLLAVAARPPALPGDGFYLAVLGVIVVSAAAAVALAMALVWAGRPEPATNRLAWFLVGGVAFVGLAYFSLPLGIPAPYGQALDILGPAAWPAVLGLGAVSLLALIRFALIFPRPLDDDDLVRPLGARAARRARALVHLLRFLRSPWSWPAFAALPAVVALMGPEPGTIVLIWVALFVLGGSYRILDLARSSLDGADRDRVGWIFVGLSAAVWALVLFGVLPFALGPLLGDTGYGLYVALFLGAGPPVVALILVLALAAAVFVGGALDPALALERTTLFGLLGALYVGAFGALENLISAWLEARIGLSGAVAAITLGGALAVLMIPLHRRLGPLVERRLARGRVEASPGR